MLVCITCGIPRADHEAVQRKDQQAMKDENQKDADGAVGPIPG